MSKRLQVVMDDAEYQEIQAAAADRRLTASAWVRQVLRRARDQGREGEDAPGPVAALRAAPPMMSAEPAATRPPPVVGEAVSELAYRDLALVREVMRRHGLPSIQDAIRYALRRAAEPPMVREEMLELRGTGWAGDLDAMR